MSSAPGTCSFTALYCRIRGVDASAAISGVEPAQADGGRHTVQREHVRGGAIIHPGVLVGEADHGVEAGHHDLLEAIVDELFVPEEALAVLHPFEVRDRDAAGVGEDIWNDEDFL